MNVIAGGKKRKVRKSIFLVIVMLAFFILPCRAEQKNKLFIGVYTGYSFGLGYEFQRHYNNYYEDEYDLNFQLGTYMQYNFSELFGLQLNMSYQNGVYRWIFDYYEDPVAETEWNGSLSFTLNGVLNYAKLKNAQLYLMGGVGILNGSLGIGNTFIDLVAGTGVKIRPKTGSRSAIVLGGTFHHLLKLDHDIYGDKHGYANFLQLQVGYEFCLDGREEQ